MKYNPLTYDYASRRTMVYGNRGMVATGNPLATLAGMEILKAGGNAVDAALAMATTLTVVEPVSNGIGGDAFAIVHDGEKIHGLNASGPSPRLISLEALKARGFTSIPDYGWEPVNVPGAVGGWMALWEKFGSLPLEKIMGSAIDYTENGYILQPNVGRNWELEVKAREKYFEDERFSEFKKVFTKDGQPYRAGEMWQSKEMAQTLRDIADTKGESFYRGALAEKIASCSKTYDGFLTEEDLAAYQPLWVEPISVNYRGYDVWEIPPNGHGISVLMTLNLLKDRSYERRDDVDTLHRQIEAMKLSFADGMNYITDREHMDVTAEELLSEAYAVKRREDIKDEAQWPKVGDPTSSGTVYMAAADQDGLMISLIQSNYTGFGSSMVVPGTGIAMHNRGLNFSFEEGHCNVVAGGKRSYHTIIPGFLTKDNKAIGPFGIMGAFMQPQAHVQVVMNTLDFHHNPQAALDAWRWQWIGGKTIEVEPAFPEYLARALQDKGHRIVYAQSRNAMGRGQIIWRDEKGIYGGGTEGRTDGCILGW